MKQLSGQLAQMTNSNPLLTLAWSSKTSLSFQRESQILVLHEYNMWQSKFHKFYFFLYKPIKTEPNLSKCEHKLYSLLSDSGLIKSRQIRFPFNKPSTISYIHSDFARCFKTKPLPLFPGEQTHVPFSLQTQLFSCHSCFQDQVKHCSDYNF